MRASRGAGLGTCCSPASVRTSRRPRRVDPGSLRNIRRPKSTEVNRSEWASSISALPSSSKPPSRTAKLKRASTRDWVSELRYIRVLRHTSRSIREMGASRSRSWRPKMTERRSSLETT
jgi:hypothetical protein